MLGRFPQIYFTSWLCVTSRSLRVLCVPVKQVSYVVLSLSFHTYDAEVHAPVEGPAFGIVIGRHW